MYVDGQFAERFAEIHVLKRISCSVAHYCIHYTKYIHVLPCFSSFSTVLSVFIFLSSFHASFLPTASPSVEKDVTSIPP